MYYVKYIKSGHILQKYVYEKLQDMPVYDNPFKFDNVSLQKNIDYWKEHNVEVRNMNDLSYLKLLGVKLYKQLSKYLVENDNWWDGEYSGNYDISEIIDMCNKEKTLVELIEFKRKEQKRKKNVNRARNTVIRLVNSNENLKTFLTLTFAENITDLKQANMLFKAFTQRYKRITGEILNYVAVIEFQERGAVHYHLVCNLTVPFKPKLGKKKTEEQKIFEQEFEKMYWKYGWVTVDPIRTNLKYNELECDNVGAYITYYMIKSAEDKRLDGNKIYQCSKGLNKPVKIVNECKTQNDFDYVNYKDMDKIKELGFSDIEPSYMNEYESEFTGKVKYYEYNLKRKSVNVEK